MEKVSLYIPCYNAGKTIRECLESILGQSYKADEILVIDDGSGDGAAEIARGFPVKIIRHNRNMGLAVSRNTAFKEARNEFVAALDADCTADARWLERLMGCFTEEAIVGAGGKVIERHALTIADKWRSTHMSQQWGDVSLENPPFLYGSNTVFKKSGAKKAGFYTEKFRINYEDVDLSKRVYDCGFKLVYNPEAQVLHARRDTTRSILATFWNWRKNEYMESGCPDNIFRRIAYRIGYLVDNVDFFGSIFHEDMQGGNHDLLPLDFIFRWYCLWQESKSLLRELLPFDRR